MNKNDGVDLKEDLGKRGNKLAEENIRDDIKYALKGDFGQAIVVTARAVYVLKWGFQAGFTFGGGCTPYPFSNIITVQVQKKLTSRYLEVITAGNQDKKLSYWASGADSAMKAPNVITFSNKDYNKFQTLAAHIHDQIASKQISQSQSGADTTGELEKYAELHNKGVITQEEFVAKKKQLLGL